LSGTVDFRALADEAALSAYLRSTCGVKPTRRIIVGLACGDAAACAMLSPAGSNTVPASARFLCGCVAKAFTASLISQLIVEGAFLIDAPVKELVGLLPTERWPLLHGITVAQLLNHTHGLDLSGFHVAPYSANLRIDVAALYLAALHAGRLAEPGEVYSYGSGGSWWAAAILERQLDMTYEEILLSRLLQPLGIVPERDQCHSGRFCPARGGALRVAVEDLLTFLSWEISRQSVDVLRAAMSASLTSLPGVGLERGAGLGWLYYGQGWFGHTALLPEASVCVRFHIETRTAIAIATESRSATLVLARLFGQALPEFREYRAPRAVLRCEDNVWDPERCPGTYQNAATRATVKAGFPPTLEIVVRDAGYEHHGKSAPLTSRLRPATQRVFLLDPIVTEQYGHWCQFIGGSAHGYRYLWNGKELLRRRDG
jgi:hypothetical protein